MLQTNIDANIYMLQTNINANTNGNIGVLGFFIPKTLVIWAYPSHITLGIWVRVIILASPADAQNAGCPYDCDSGFFQSGLGWVPG